MVLLGSPYYQSLVHAINVGALENFIPNRKVILILSPQWFEKPYDPAAFSSRFLELNFASFLKNKNISGATRERVFQRVQDLLNNDPVWKQQIELYDHVYIQRTTTTFQLFSTAVHLGFLNKKLDYQFWREIQNDTVLPEKMVLAEEIDFPQLMSEAEKAGERACTNNELFIEDSYYNTYIKQYLEDGEEYLTAARSLDPDLNQTSEYDDFRLFLDVCRDVKISPLIVNIPVNGRWYDFLSVSKEERETYYQRIRDICSEYNVEIADFSEQEYEPYFLKDVMHIGWKGWVYLDEAAYKFYKG